MDSFSHDPTIISKKIFHSKPRSHVELRDCSSELDGAKLQNIFSGPKIINFGSVFIKSLETRTFAIKNNLRFYIK